MTKARVESLVVAALYVGVFAFFAYGCWVLG